jgi:hypothetical protein
VTLDIYDEVSYITDDGGDGPAGTETGMAKFNIYYMKPEFFRDGMMGAKWLDERSKLPKGSTIEATHVLLREIELPVGKVPLKELEEVYHQQQGEVWSPNGEARELIEAKGLQHTSMSMGDVIEVGGHWFIVDRFGFMELEQ